MPFVIYDSSMKMPAQYVTAPAGYSRRTDGSIYRDGCPASSGAEWGAIPYKFKTHRAAARALSKCFESAVIREVE